MWSYITESFSSKMNCVSPLRGKKWQLPAFVLNTTIQCSFRLKCYPHVNLSELDVF